MRSALLLSFLVLSSAVASWRAVAITSSDDPTSIAPATVPAPAATTPAPAATSPADLPGLHNVVAFGEGLYSGSAPDGQKGFEALAELGVRTIISVDGAAPDVEAARARGLRYVHLPIGYNGMDRARTLEIARAIRDLPGPVYVHCHHGKHRSAGAAGAAAVALGRLTPTTALERMRVSGTSPSYRGLFACVANATTASPEELSAASSVFPETWRTTGLVRSMVDADAALDNLKAIERASWTTPTDHPDLVPAAEAGRLADLMRNLADDAEVKAKPAAFIADLADASALVAALERELVSGEHDPKALSARLREVARSCTACHAAFRD